MNFLWGALSTLIVTAFVQIVVVPWVQRHNRRRERWEKDVTELVNIMEVDLPGALRSLGLAWIPLLAAREYIKDRGADRLNMERIEVEFMQPANAQATAAYNTLKDLVSRAILLQRRVSLINPEALLWIRLSVKVRGLNVYLWSLDPTRLEKKTDLTDDEHQVAVDKFEEQSNKVLEMVKTFSDPMKPPRSYPVRRARAWLNKRAARLRDRVRGAPAVEAGAEDT